MKLPVLLLLPCLSLLGCGARQSLPVFTVAGEQEKSVDLQLDSAETGRYLLEEPVVVTGTDRAFNLRYRGGGPGSSVRVFGGGDREIAVKILPAATEAVIYLPLRRGQVVRGFQLDTPAASGAKLLGVGIGDGYSGFRNTGGLLTIGTAVQQLQRDARALRLDVEVPEDWRIAVTLETYPAFDYADFRLRASPVDTGVGSNLSQPATGSAVEPTAELSPVVELQPAAGPVDESTVGPANRRTSVLLRLQSGARSATFRHSALPGEHTLFLYQGMVPFIPETLAVEPADGAAVWLESLEVDRISPVPDESPAGAQPGSQPDALGPGSQHAGALQPLPADPGALLLYDPKSWRRSDYELFAWNRFPRILIMDTASYAVQSRFFKRLAFFVERRGYRGRLLRNEEFAGLHGFNAHDYRAEDLARFFQAAREQHFALNPEEELLKQILLANGIIRDEGAFTPGRGAILSISRSSYPILRRHLLTHECAHGLFFSLPEFREASFQAWERLSPEEKAYWKLFFRWVGYDTDDLYLTINEYQAYLFQQPRSGVRYYFTVLTPARLVSSYPGEASRVRELVRSDPERFTRAFDELESSLVQIAGVEGGRIIELELAE